MDELSIKVASLITAVQQLLDCPDLNLDTLEKTTRQAIRYAEEILEEIEDPYDTES